MSSTITEPSRSLPVIGEWDVVVVGGGLAGVAAALAARRNGARVALVEKEYGLGGLATLGNVLVFLPLCDGEGHQVIGGLGEELLRLSVKDLRRTDKALGWATVPACWDADATVEERRQERFITRFNPFAYQIELEAAIVADEVDLWYDTRLCQCVVDGDRITHLIVENKDGRGALACRAVVDASGDADVCALAGEQTESLDTNVLAAWHYVLTDGALQLRAMSKPFDEFCTAKDSDGPLFAGDNARDVTQQVLQTRAWIRDHLAAKRAERPEAEIQPFAIGSFPSFRMTRRLVSSFSLSRSHDHVWFDDCVGLTGDWRRRRPVFSVPLRALRGERCHNLLAAGRCMSSDTSVWDAMRAIPACVMTGEAAGTTAAAAVATTAGDVHALDIPALQDRLRAHRVILDRELVEWGAKEAG